MTIEEAETQAEMLGAMSEGSGRKSREYGVGAANVTACIESSWTEGATRQMEEVVSRSNMMASYQRVVSNKGAAGIDGIAGIESNTVILGWPNDLERLVHFLRVIRPLNHLNQSLLIGRAEPLVPLQEGQRRTMFAAQR